MASNRLSFSIAINLLTQGVKKGANDVKNSLRSIQMQVLTFAAALGAGGLGLTSLISRFTQVARETSRVTTALKNVSGGVVQFVDNQRFLIDLAKKYGIEINGLTESFAKFTASASNAGVTMDNQKKIFESVSRATTAFGLSSDETKGVMLALSQMMGKGKISSEELRKQMGEKLPVAMAAMAKAAGVSMGGLEKLLEQGKLMSADILPKFAEALNEMIPNVDTDNLESSINKLQNAFGDLVNGMDVQSKYKSLVDWVTGATEKVSANIKNIITGLVAVISGLLANTVVKWWASLGTLTTSLEASMTKSNAVLLAATQQRIAAELALERAKAAELVAIDTERIAAANQVTQAQKNLKAATVAEEKAQDMSKVAAQKIADSERIAQAKASAATMIKTTQQRIAAEIALETAKAELVAARAAVATAVSYEQTITAKARLIKAEEQFSLAVRKHIKAVTDEAKASDAAKVASAKASSIKTATVWQATYTRIKVATAKLVVSLQAMWSAFAPMLVVTAIVAIIGRLKQMYDDAKRIKSLFSEYKKRVETVTTTEDVAKVKLLQEEYNKANVSLDDKKRILGQINKILGTNLSVNKNISTEIAKQIALLESAARAEAAARELVDSEGEIRKIGGKKYNGYAVRDMAPEWAAARGDWKKETQFKDKYGITSGARELTWKFGGFKNDLDAYIENAKIRKDAKERLSKEITKTTTITPIKPGPDDKKTELQKLEEKYAQSLRELNARREVEKMSIDDYNKAYDELNKNALIEAKSSADKVVLNSDHIKKLQEEVNNPTYGSVRAELAKVEEDYKTAMDLAKSKLDRKIISEDEYRDAIINAATSAANSAISIKDVGEAADEFIDRVRGEAISRIEAPTLGKRDATFDYKASGSDKASGELDAWKKYRDELEELKKKHGELSRNLQDELTRAISKVPELEQALKLAQVQEDIKDLSKELNHGIYDGIKDVGSIADRLVSSFQDLKDAFDPESEADGWERLMAVWNAFTNVADSILSVCETITALTELTQRLTHAKEAETVVEADLMAAKAANATTEATILATQTASEVAAASVKTTAASAEMAAKTTAAYAGIPYVGPALAAAQIAAMEAMIVAASIPKFANGGIITGGPSSGDKILARVNAGEMILNQGQQSRLFQAINSGNLGGGGSGATEVKFRISGTDLVGAMTNFQKRKSKIR